jgi:hypothetical protein
LEECGKLLEELTSMLRKRKARNPHCKRLKCHPFYIEEQKSSKWAGITLRESGYRPLLKICQPVTVHLCIRKKPIEMKRSTKFMLLLIALLAIIESTLANTAPAKAQVHSMMMYNFMKYVEWPEAMKGDHFTVAVIGDKEVFQTMERLYSSKKVGNQSLRFVYLTSVSDIKESYHMAYLGEEMAHQFSALSGKLEGQSTLIVTYGDTLGQQGSAINFVLVDGHPKFELNKAAIDKQGLKVSSALANLDILV